MGYSPQEARLVRYLFDHKKITLAEAFHLGCGRISARMYDLRRKGVPINTRRIDPPTKTDPTIYEYWISPEWLMENERP